MKELIRKQSSSSLTKTRYSSFSKSSCPVLLESFNLLCHKSEFITNLDNSKCKELWNHLVNVCRKK